MSDSAPPPLEVSATLHGGLDGKLEAQASLGPLPKPPWWQNEGVAKVRDEVVNWLLEIDWSSVLDWITNLLSRRRVREA